MKPMEEKLLIAVLPLYDGDNTCYMVVEDDIDWHSVQEYLKTNLSEKKSQSIRFIRRTRDWYEKLTEMN